MNGRSGRQPGVTLGGVWARLIAFLLALALLAPATMTIAASTEPLRQPPIVEVERPAPDPAGLPDLTGERIVPGKGAWYLEGKAHPAGDGGAGDTLGLRIGDKTTGKTFYFLAACAKVTGTEA